ncbi:hypothetical protein [Marinomonas sp. THO17]|uniref:hypothetical protein n=1 Tax=Marinomonas sp. THO17 TaxID=3149048 RepID=UPI00336C1561
MSDLAANQNEDFFEPDEETLISALRNQDDIPILMDVVTDPDSFDDGVSQEEHLTHSVEDAVEQGVSPLVDEEVPEHTEVNQTELEHAIATVLAKRLPDLIAEVMQVMQTSELGEKQSD